MGRRKHDGSDTLQNVGQHNVRVMGCCGCHMESEPRKRSDEQRRNFRDCQYEGQSDGANR